MAKTMRTLILLSTFALMCSAAIAAPVYQCIDARGQRSYSQTAGKNCQPANLGRVGAYTPSAPTAVMATPTLPTPIANETPSTNVNDVQVARERLDEARRNLDAGKHVRYGNERNYAKYLERIAGLEAAVQQSEQVLQQLQQPTSEAPVSP